MEEINGKKNDGVLLLMAILFAVFQMGSIVFEYFSDSFELYWAAESVLMVVLCFVMYGSYHNHKKNMMKSVIGATLIMFLYYRLDWVFYYIQYFDELLNWYPDVTALKGYLAVNVGLLISLALICIMHFLINYTHHSSPKKVKVNKIFYSLYFILSAVKVVYLLIFEEGVYVQAADFTRTFALAFALIMVIIIETKLDSFRLDREARVS